MGQRTCLSWKEFRTKTSIVACWKNEGKEMTLTWQQAHANMYVWIIVGLNRNKLLYFQHVENTICKVMSVRYIVFRKALQNDNISTEIIRSMCQVSIYWLISYLKAIMNQWFQRPFQFIFKLVDIVPVYKKIPD